MTSLGRLSLFGLAIAAGCSSPAPQAADHQDEGLYRAIAKGMTKDEVVDHLGRPDPTASRPDVWDYLLGGPQDPVYRFIFEAGRVVHIKRFDGYAVVDPSGNINLAPDTTERR